MAKKPIRNPRCPKCQSTRVIHLASGVGLVCEDCSYAADGESWQKQSETNGKRANRTAAK